MDEKAGLILGYIMVVVFIGIAIDCTMMLILDKRFKRGTTKRNYQFNCSGGLMRVLERGTLIEYTILRSWDHNSREFSRQVGITCSNCHSRNLELLSFSAVKCIACKSEFVVDPDKVILKRRK